MATRKGEYIENLKRKNCIALPGKLLFRMGYGTVVRHSGE